MAAVLFFVTLEVGIRAYLSFKIGPSVLLHGTPFDRAYVLARSDFEKPDSGTDLEEREAQSLTDESVLAWGESAHSGYVSDLRESLGKETWRRSRTVTVHSNKTADYSKYHPHQRRADFDIESGERFEVSINGAGFRGRDSAAEPAADVIRVVTLGASSTFGYFSRDHQTYPAQLERILNDRHGDMNRFEVINLGIPHLKAMNIRALFAAEGAALRPDVVTLYAGSNDASEVMAEQNWLTRRVARAGRYLVALRWLASVLEHRERGGMTLEEVRRRAAIVSSDFLRSVSRIHQECEERGILFVVANQQKTSQLIKREDLKGLTYGDELRRILEKVSESELVRSREAVFLAHSVIMDELERWTETAQVPFVDVIAALDRDRNVMVSTVHLSPRGNQMVARAFAEEIGSRYRGSISPSSSSSSPTRAWESPPPG